MTLDWPTWLDRLEASITACRAAVAEGRHDDVVTSDAPVGLGPLPVDLERRARVLLRLNASLTDELTTACAAHGRQLKLLTALHPHEGASCSYLDTRT